MLEVMREAGFRRPSARQFFDTFRGTTKEKIARKYGVRGANFVAYK
jgi:abortive infection bacteriophage resistance protein